MIDKPALRAQLRLRRRELSTTHPDAADKAAAHLPMDMLGEIRIASGYRPMGGELDPGPILRRLEQAGARIVLPVAVSRHDPLIFRLFKDGDPLVHDAVGIAAPTVDGQEATPDLLIVPLLGFDRHGNRLGQGAGHYDRTLSALRATGKVWAIGLAYAGQLIDELPYEPHDERLDAILTETGYHTVGS